MSVIIHGIEYVPKTEVKELSEGTTKEVLKILTGMRYFNESHKMMGLAWNAINEISPELSEMGVEEAYDFVHGREED